MINSSIMENLMNSYPMALPDIYIYIYIIYTVKEVGLKGAHINNLCTAETLTIHLCMQKQHS